MNFLVVWLMCLVGMCMVFVRVFFLFVVCFLFLVFFGFFLIQVLQVLVVLVFNICMIKYNLLKDSGNIVCVVVVLVVGQVMIDQICVFCYILYGLSSMVKSLLWNCDLKVVIIYIGYILLLMDVDVGGFKIDNIKGCLVGVLLFCFLCYDGMIVLGNVNVLEVKMLVIIDMIGGDVSDMMLVGSGVDIGYIWWIGVNFSNDYLILVIYNSNLVDMDKELWKMNGNQ